MADLIDRQAVINKICDKKCFISRKFCTHLEPCEDIRIIESAPAIEPKRGEWIEQTAEWVDGVKFVLAKCAVCGNRAVMDMEQLNDTIKFARNFCGHCGADMRAKHTILDYVGAELDPEYFKLGNERFERETAQGNLFT